MDQNQATKPNYKHFTEKEDQAFYAAFLNTAIHNVYTIFKDVSESLGMPFKDHDTKMLKSALIRKLESNEEPELSQKIIERLSHQFSFLRFLALNNAKNRTEKSAYEVGVIDYFQVLNLWVSQLSDYRNFYSHAFHASIDMDSDIIDGMRVLYDAAWKEFKRRKALSNNETAHLIRRGKNGESPHFHYAFLNKEDKLTEKGFLYFVCLWLEKKDAQEFLKKHKGFKRGESKSQKATLEKFTWFRTRVPKPRLTSDNSLQGLFMDMVNDLERCPAVLFDLLSDEDKARFHKEDEEDEEGDYEATPYLIRKTNRFYYFAMRYLERSFEHLKFHIDLGNYCFKTYDQIIEGVPRKRRWITRITAFGNLVDFRDSEPPSLWKDKLLSMKEVEKPPVYITPTTPHYHFDPNSKVNVIGLKWVEGYNERGIWPDIGSASAGEKYRSDPPDFWLSLYELPSLVFYQILHEQGLAEHSAEKVIMNYQYKLNKGFMNNVAEGRILPGMSKSELEENLHKRGLDLQDIPKSVVNYLLSKDTMSVAEKAKMRLVSLKEENTHLLSQLERQENHYRKKPGSKDYVPLKAGVIADFLAHDMLLLQKPVKQDQGKANGTEFQVLQAKLAYFSQNKETLNETFKLCNLTDAPNTHPFLNKIEVATCRGIVNFYEKYLLQRAKFLEHCLKEKAYTQYHFLKVKEVPDDIETVIRRQQEAVLNLPRGLFRRPIQAAVEKSVKNDSFKELVRDKQNNNAFIIREYFKLIQDDTTQAFYGFERNYELLTELYDTRRPKDRKPANRKFLTPDQLVENYQDIKQKLAQKIGQKLEGVQENSPEESRIRNNYSKRYKRFMNNEQTIRLFKTCDMVQFLMVDQLYHQLGLEQVEKVKQDRPTTAFELGDDYKLKKIMPDNQSSILSLKTQVRLPMEKKVIVRDNMKIKNYGDFRLFLKDRRVQGLLDYIDAEEIAYEALKRELEEFDKCRKEVIEGILSFEGIVAKMCNMELVEETFLDHEAFLNKKLGECTEDFKSMVLLRNAFLHSFYPAYETFQDKISGLRFNELKDYRADDKEVSEKSVIHQLKNLTLKYYQGASESF